MSEQKAVKKTLTIPAWLNELAEKADVPFSKLLQKALMDEVRVHSYEEYLALNPKTEVVVIVRCKNCGRYSVESGICDFWGEPRHPEHFCEEGEPRE